MERRPVDDETLDNRETSRRSFVKTVGLTATAAAGTALFGTSASAATVVDLGEKGLSNGDEIDPYLEEHFTDGNEVHVPAGEYQYSGGGMGGDKSDCALIGSPEGVTFNRPGPETVVRPTLWATSGTVRIENVTIAGERGEEQSRLRVGAAEEATVEIVNVNMPDGTVDGSDSTGIYAGTDHAGTLKVRHCYFSDFGNVACYVSDPYMEGNGKVVVEDCDFVNTGMSALRLAPDDSEVRRCYFEATEKAASSHVGFNQRGIKIDDAGTGVVVEDCDFKWANPGRTMIKFDDKGEGGEGVMRNLRIVNNGDDPTFAQDWDVSGNWSGENIHLSGSGDHNVPEGFETVTGADAKKPNTEYEIWTPQGNQSGSGSGSGGGGSGSGGSGSDGSSSGGSGGESTESESGTESGDESSSESSGGATETAAATATTATATTAVDGGSSDDGGGDGASGGGAAGEATEFEKVLLVDGSGDSAETARYRFTVSGEAARNEEHSETPADGTPWDRLSDQVTDGTIAGVIGSGVDAYGFSGRLTGAEVRGEATFTVVRS